MPEPTITLACQDYDHTRALVDGAVTVKGYDLKTTTISPPSQIFLRMLNKEEFDASEMSLSNYIIALGHGDRRFVAIPVFPSRVFRHSYIWINANAGIREPRDLIGKRVGIADYSMTALLFVRGMLKHEYDVLPEDIHWFRRRSEHVSIKAPANLRIDNIEKGTDSGQSTGRRQTRCGGSHIASAKLPKWIAPREAALPGCQAGRVRILSSNENLSNHAPGGNTAGGL